MIWCMLDNNRAQSKEGYMISKIPVGIGTYSYMVLRPSGYVLAWIGAEVPEGRKVALRAYRDDLETYKPSY